MTHNEVIELLPWYANQSLDDAEREHVAEHLAACARCARELKMYQSIRSAVVESADEAPEPSKNLLRQAMGEIQLYEQQKAEKSTTAPVAWLTEPLGKLGDTLFGWIGPAPVLARAVVAGQFLVVLALAAALGFSLLKQDDYVTQSGKPPKVHAGAIIAVKFHDTISEAQLRQTVTEFGGSISAGPSALGIYTIEVPIDREKTAEVEKLVERLKQKSAVVSYAERKD